MKRAQLNLSRIIKGLAFMLILAPIAVSAQTKDKLAVASRTPEQRATMMTERLQQKLNLNSQQTTKVKAITEKYAQQVENLNKTSTDQATKAKTRQEILANMGTDMKKVLTADQYTQYQAMVNSMQHAHSPAAGPMAKAAK